MKQIENKYGRIFQENKKIFMAYGVMCVLLVAAEIASPGFLALSHMKTLARSFCFLGIITIGQTYVILSGGIDLSVAWTITLSNVISAQIMNGQDSRCFQAFVYILILGMLVGLINGIGIHYLRISPLVMTLAMGSVLQGVAFIYCKGAPKGAAAPFVKTLATQTIAGIPILMFIWLILAILAVTWLNFTVFGRNIHAIGINMKAATYSGISLNQNIIRVYMISGIMSSIVGFLLIGYTGTSFLDVGSTYTMNSIAAVVIGGTSIAGGLGGYVGSIAGTVIMTVVISLLTTLKMPEFARQIMQGMIILLILLSYGRSGSREKRRKTSRKTDTETAE